MVKYWEMLLWSFINDMYVYSYEEFLKITVGLHAAGILPFVFTVQILKHWYQTVFFYRN